MHVPFSFITIPIGGLNLDESLVNEKKNVKGILLILTSNTITFLTSPNFSHSAFISLRKSVIKTGFFYKEKKCIYDVIKLQERFIKQYSGKDQLDQRNHRVNRHWYQQTIIDQSHLGLKTQTCTQSRSSSLSPYWRKREAHRSKNGFQVDTFKKNARPSDLPMALTMHVSLFPLLTHIPPFSFFFPTFLCTVSKNVSATCTQNVLLLQKKVGRDVKSFNS